MRHHREPTSALRLLTCALLLVLASSAFPIDSAKPVVIQLWGMTEQELFAGFGEALHQYEREHPGIKIERGSPGGMAQGSLDPQKMMTTFVAGTPPDIVLMDRFQLSGWAARGVFMPLDDFYARDAVDRADIYPACLDECVFGGKTYGVPWYTDSRALWCNMDLLAKAGYKGPPKDWDELVEMNKKLSSFTPDNKIQIIGFAPMFGNSWLYMFGWLNGGEFVSADGRQITISDPRIVAALEWMNKCYEPLGGAQRVEDFRAAAQGEGASEPFRAGRIAMEINENGSLDYIAKYVPDLNLKACPPPAPKGLKSVSWSGGFCWSIPKGAPHAEEAWKIARYLTSLECWTRAGDYQVEQSRRKAAAEGKDFAPYVPQLSCSKKINAAQVERYKPNMPAKVAAAYAVHADLLNICRFRPLVPVGGTLWDELNLATNQVLYDHGDAKQSLEASEKRVQVELDKFYAPNKAPVYPIGRVFGWLFTAVLGIGGAAWLFAASRWQWSTRVTSEARAGILFASPWLIGFIVLMLGPMLGALLMALSEYDVISPSRWAGLGNFIRLMGFARDETGHLAANDPLFWKSLSNTLWVTAVGVPLGIIVSLGLALLVNAEVRGVRIYRTLFYVPVIVPTVATAIMWMWLLNGEIGVSGWITTALHLPPISFFGDPRYANLGVVLMCTWGAGGSMIIWLAGLKGISRTYYEAAAIDGASPMQQFIRITLPMLTPYLFFNLIMGIIGWLQIFTQAFVLIVPPGYGPADCFLYYVIYLFVQGFQYFNMGIACAMAWILFVIVALLTWLQFRLAPKWVHYDT